MENYFSLFFTERKLTILYDNWERVGLLTGNKRHVILKPTIIAEGNL